MSETLAKHVGGKLRRVRLLKGLTLLQVGEAIRVAPQTVQRLEVGSMTLSLKWVERLCQVYDVRPVDLFDGAPLATFDAKLQRDNARAAIKTLCKVLNLPCPESLE